MFSLFSVLASAVDTTAVEATQTAKDALIAISGLTLAEILQLIVDNCIIFGGKIIKVIIVWGVGRWFTRRLVALAKILMEKRDTNPTVQSFFISVIDVALLIALIIMIISIFGIDTSSFVALFASAGVAIGMATMVVAELAATGHAELGTQVNTVVLCATLVYELIGPVITKWALTKSGEIKDGTVKEEIHDHHFVFPMKALEANTVIEEQASEQTATIDNAN